EFAGQFELHTVGYHDFWFSNPHDVPVKVSIHLVNCKCAKVEACTLSAEAANQVRRWQVAASGFPALPGHGGPLRVLPQLIADDTLTRDHLGVKLKWTPLKDDAGSVKDYVRAEPQGAGVVRVYWEAKDVGLKRVTAQLQTQPEGHGAISRPSLE